MLVNICTQLSHELAKLLISSEFPMYFVKQCNLKDIIRRDNASKFENFVSILGNITDDQSSCWFRDNYINHRFSQYPHHAARLNDLIKIDLQEALRAVSNERRRDLNNICCDDLERIAIDLQTTMARCFKIQSIGMHVEQLQSIDSRLTDFYYVLSFFALCVRVGTR